MDERIAVGVLRPKHPDIDFVDLRPIRKENVIMVGPPARRWIREMERREYLRRRIDAWFFPAFTWAYRIYPRLFARLLDRFESWVFFTFFAGRGDDLDEILDHARRHGFMEDAEEFVKRYPYPWRR